MGNAKKRAMAAAAGTALFALALTGCGGGSSSGGSSNGGGSGSGKTLDVFIGVNTQNPQEQKAWFDRTAAAFKKETGASVTWETFSSASDELTKIQTSVVSGQGPDVYAIGTTFTPTAYATKAFITLSDAQWKQIGGKDKFVPASLGISGPDPQHQVGIPWVGRPFVMAYNTEMLKAAGIDKPADSWDGLTEQAKKLTKDGQYGLAIGYKDNYDPWKFIWGMSVQAGNPIVNGTKAQINDPAVEKAFETYFGWVTSDKVVDPASIGWSDSQALASFSQGKAAYMPMTSALAQVTLDKSPVKGKYAFALMPTIPPGMTSRPPNGADAASILSGDNLVVADYSSNKDLAFQFVKMLTDPTAQKDIYDSLGQLPDNAQVAEGLKSNQMLAPVLEALAKSKATPFTGAWADIQLALTNAVVQSIPQLASGTIATSTIQSRLATAQQTAQTALDRAK